MKIIIDLKGNWPFSTSFRLAAGSDKDRRDKRLFTLRYNSRAQEANVQHLTTEKPRVREQREARLRFLLQPAKCTNMEERRELESCIYTRWLNRQPYFARCALNSLCVGIGHLENKEITVQHGKIKMVCIFFHKVCSKPLHAQLVWTLSLSEFM